MVRRVAVLLSAFIVTIALAPGAGASKARIPGTTQCAFGGALFFDHGLPLTPPGPATRKYTGHLRSVSGATGCQTAADLVFDGIIVKLQGTSVTPKGAPRPSCIGLANNPPTTYKATLQFRTHAPKGPTVATAKATLATTAVSLGTPVSFDLSGTISTGAFAGEHLAIHMAFDQQWPYLVNDCSDANGLKNLDMTGIFASTLSIAP
jgi:hypothetical protein